MKRCGEGICGCNIVQDCKGASDLLSPHRRHDTSRCFGRHILLIALVVLVHCIGNPHICPAQQLSSFGLLSTSELPGSAYFAAPAQLNADSLPDLVYYDEVSKQLFAVLGNGDGSYRDQFSLYETDSPASIAAGFLNNDNRTDIVVVHRNKSEIDVVLTNIGDSISIVRQYPVNFYPEKAVIADIDGDGWNDILVYGKLSSGISVLLGDGNGGFSQAKLIIDDIPVSELTVTKLNGDSYPDFVAKNWLQNELLFFTGKGGMQYSLQQMIPLGSDSTTFFLGDFNADGLQDYGLVVNKKLQLYLSEGLSSYTQYQTGDYPQPVTTAYVIELTNPKYPDIILYDEQGGTIDLFTNRGDGTYNNGIVFGLPSKTGECFTCDVNNDGYTDLLLLENGGRSITTYWNGKQPSLAQYVISTGKREIKMPSGRRPIGLAVADVNSDGYDDVIAVNNQSSSFSLFLNSAGGFTGQLGFRTIDNPFTVRLYGKTDTSFTFLLGHELTGKVSILQARRDTVASLGYSFFTYAIRTAERPKIILPNSTLQDRAIEFYTYSGDRQNMLSYYRQVEGTRFIERSLKPIIPSKILAASVNDFNDDRRPDIAYLYYDTDSLNYNLAITFSDSNGFYRGKTRSYVFTDSTIRRAFLYFEDMNGDNIPDCILYSAPDNTVRISLGKGDGIFGQFIVVAGSVGLLESEHLQIVDFDRDGINDIVLLNEQTSELQFFKGKGNGKLLPPVFLLDLPKNSTFRFGDFNLDGTLDIVYSNPSQNEISVYYSTKK